MVHIPGDKRREAPERLVLIATEAARGALRGRGVDDESRPSPKAMANSDVCRAHNTRIRVSRKCRLHSRSNPKNNRPSRSFQKHSHSWATYSILVLVMTKRKPGTFSATKAVKANARERVGQPKPVRVVDTEPRTGRQAKHKPKLEEIIRQGE